jgi:hypothetical protein
MTDDTAFERDLRAMLAARDPGQAPARLAETVRKRLAVPSSPNRFVAFGRLAGASVVVGAAAALILAIVVARPIATGPGASPLPTPTAAYTIQPGAGVVGDAQVPFFQALAGLAAVGLLVALYARTRLRWVRIAAALGVLSIAFVALNIGTPNAIGFVQGQYGVDPGREGPPDEPGMYVAVTGDSPFTMVLTVTNTSRLPLEVRGLAKDEAIVFDTGRVLIPRFVGLGVYAEQDPHVTQIEPTQLAPFQPFVLQAGEERDLVFLGLAGACAIPSVGPEGQSGYTMETVRIVYEQLTIEHVASIDLPEPVEITTPGSCP